MTSAVSVMAAAALVILAGAVIGQIFLSRALSRIPGLVLPCTTLLFSILAVCNVAILPGSAVSEAVRLVGGTFLLCNIPTAILLTIYFAVRSGKKRLSEMDSSFVRNSRP